MTTNRLRSLLALADQVAGLAHKGQLDKAGQPYILHPQAVAAAVERPEEKIVALLHDVCEDSPMTPKDLLALGFPGEIVRSVDLLTRRAHQDYDAYLVAIAADPLARAVKLADLRHNLDLSRLPRITQRDLRRQEKYRKALAFLEDGPAQSETNFACKFPSSGL